MGTSKCVEHPGVRVQAMHCGHIKVCRAPRSESAGYALWTHKGVVHPGVKVQAIYIAQ